MAAALGAAVQAHPHVPMHTPEQLRAWPAEGSWPVCMVDVLLCAYVCAYCTFVVVNKQRYTFSRQKRDCAQQQCTTTRQATTTTTSIIPRISPIYPTPVPPLLFQALPPPHHLPCTAPPQQPQHPPSAAPTPQHVVWPQHSGGPPSPGSQGPPRAPLQGISGRALCALYPAPHSSGGQGTAVLHGGQMLLDMPT